MVKNRELFSIVKMAYLSDADRCRAMQVNRIGGKIGGKNAVERQRYFLYFDRIS